MLLNATQYVFIYPIPHSASANQQVSEEASDDTPDWLSKYCAEMEAMASSFPISEKDMDELHIKHYDSAYEQMLLNSATSRGGDTQQRPVKERIKSKKERAALTAAKTKFIERNEAAALATYTKALRVNRAEAAPLSKEDADRFLAFVLEKSDNGSDERSLKLAAAAIAKCVNEMHVSGGSGGSKGTSSADVESLSQAHRQAEASLEAQIRANRLLGSRVEELERENLELHRILDDNTNKALDSWSSGQIKVAKLEEELNTVKGEKRNSEMERDKAKAEVKELETKLARLKNKMEDFIEEEEQDDKKAVRTIFLLVFFSFINIFYLL